MDRINIQFQDKKEDFLPLTMTRSELDLRVGLFTFREKWIRLAKHQNIAIGFDQEDKQDWFNFKMELYIPSNQTNLRKFLDRKTNPLENGCKSIEKPSDILMHLQWSMMDDFEGISSSIPVQKIPSSVQQMGTHELIVHQSAIIEPCFINTNDGPVFIDENAHIMQGAMLRGPVYVGKNSVVKMGATLYQGTCIGENCVIGGEVKNSIFHAFSNKSHHGYIGDSYIGEWCNLGAGTSCSNVKNTTSPIRTYSMKKNDYENAGLKCGVIMGDHVRTAIHTAFNSGTVIGSFSNIFEINGLTPKFIPPFSWGGSADKKYDLEKLILHVKGWQEMKGYKASQQMTNLITTLYKNLL